MAIKYKAITVAALSVWAVAAWAPWQSETIASQGDVGAGCCLATDRWGRPYISYADLTQEKVMCARYNGTSWEFQTVASDVGVFGRTGIALDSFDNPYVVFQDNKEVEVVYAYLSGSNWVTEKAGGGSGLGDPVSIVVRPTEPRVAYYRQGYKYAYRDGEGWHVETITSNFGEFITLFTDNENTPNVVYYSNGTNSVERAVRKNEEWSIDNISEGVDPDAFFGPNEKIHVSFAGYNNNGLTYAVSTTGGSWKFENVKVAVGAPGCTKICANAAGDVFITYFNFNQHNLHVVMKQDNVWSHERVATGGFVGNPHSIALDSDGYPLIAYYDANNGDLKLAHHVLSGIELESFTACRSADDGVNLRWAVERPETVTGFNIYRAAGDGESEKVNTALIVGASPFRFRDAEAPENAAVEYLLEAVTATGATQTFGPATVPPAIKRETFTLHQNVPNPVSEATTFSFELRERADVTLAVYDAAGRAVATVAKGCFAAGRHDVGFQNHLPPGVYVYRLSVGGETAARRMVVVK